MCDRYSNQSHWRASLIVTSERKIKERGAGGGGLLYHFVSCHSAYPYEAVDYALDRKDRTPAKIKVSFALRGRPSELG